MKTQNENQTFWLVVVDCLVRFHKCQRQQAETAVHRFQSELSSQLARPEVDLIYHEEPFSVACEIARKSLDVAKHRSEYEHILKDRDW